MKCKVPTFNGGNWAAFRQQFEKLARYYAWDSDTKALYLHTSIQGDAADALGAADSAAWNYEELIEHLEKRHGRSKTYAQVLNEVCALYRRVDQTTTEWHDQVIKIANTAPLSLEQYRHVAFHGFTFGLRNYPMLQTWVLNKDELRTLQNATALAEQFEHDYGPANYLPAPLSSEAAQTTYVHHKVVPAAVVPANAKSDAAVMAQLVKNVTAQMQTTTTDNRSQAPPKSAKPPAPAAGRPPAAQANGKPRQRGRRGQGNKKANQDAGQGQKGAPGQQQGQGAPQQQFQQNWGAPYNPQPQQPWGNQIQPLMAPQQHQQQQRPQMQHQQQPFYPLHPQQQGQPGLPPPPPAPPMQRPPRQQRHQSAN